MTGITVLDLLLSLRDEKIMAMYTTKGLDHLGLVAGMCEEIGIAKIIDQALPEQRPDKHITCGQLVVAMILNGLGFVYIKPDTHLKFLDQIGTNSLINR